MTSLATLHLTETVEIKRSAAELKRAGGTLCAFMNGEGGQVLIGVPPDGRLVGQEVADITLRDIAATLGRFEPAGKAIHLFLRVIARRACGRFALSLPGPA